MDKEKQLCIQLKTQVLNLLDDILIICPNEPELILVRIYFDVKTAPEILMKGFIKYVYPWKEHIKQRDEIFFEKSENIFGTVPNNKISYIKNKIKDGTFDEQDKKIIWQYFDIFIKIIEKYNKII